ncbi:MAG: hypothetical protein RIB47_14910 [Cyclobacteriaceae bacterium]
MEDGSDRVVFTNELGVTFFDLWFSDRGDSVVYAMDKLNRRPITRTLIQDFELLLMRDFKSGVVEKYHRGDESLYSVSNEGKYNYLITSTDCSSLLRLEQGSSRKKLMDINFTGDNKIDKIIIQHFNFDMRIVLVNIED